MELAKHGAGQYRCDHGIGLCDRDQQGDRGGFNAGGDASLLLLNARGIAGGFCHYFNAADMVYQPATLS